MEAAIDAYSEKDAEESPKLAFDVRWRPFQLNPSLPKGRGLDKMQYYYDRFGMPRVDGMIRQMKAVGRDVGISHHPSTASRRSASFLCSTYS